MVEQEVIKTQDQSSLLNDSRQSLIQLTNNVYESLVISNIVYLIIIQVVLNGLILAAMGRLNIILWNTIISFVVTLIAAYIISFGYQIIKRYKNKWKFLSS